MYSKDNYCEKKHYRQRITQLSKPKLSTTSFDFVGTELLPFDISLLMSMPQVCISSPSFSALVLKKEKFLRVWLVRLG